MQSGFRARVLSAARSNYSQTRLQKNLNLSLSARAATAERRVALQVASWHHQNLLRCPVDGARRVTRHEPQQDHSLEAAWRRSRLPPYAAMPPTMPSGPEAAEEEVYHEEACWAGVELEAVQSWPVVVGGHEKKTRLAIGVAPSVGVLFEGRLCHLISLCRHSRSPGSSESIRPGRRVSKAQGHFQSTLIWTEDSATV